MTLDIDPVRAALEGVDAASVAAQVQTALAGSVATSVSRPPKSVAVRVRLPAGARASTDDLTALELTAPDGHAFALDRVADLSIDTGRPEIARDNLRRMASVTARTDGDLGGANAAARRAIDAAGVIPAGFSYELGGLYAEQQAAFRGMAAVIVAGALLVFLLLLFLYESFRIAGAMLLVTVPSMAAVFLGLWLTGTDLNITALMGMVMIVGNVTEVGVFYVSELREPDGGDHRTRNDRLIAAGLGRVRAISITTLAAILALLPLAWGVGEGSGLLQPLAVAIISGLVAQLPLVLVLLPVLLAALGVGAGEAPADGGETSTGVARSV